MQTSPRCRAANLSPRLFLGAAFTLSLCACGGGGGGGSGGSVASPPVATPVAPAPVVVPPVVTLPPGAPETATVAQGTLSGVRHNEVAAYAGIPYAAPPVGDLRWRAPAAPAAWSGTRSATTFANECQQVLPNGAFRAWTSEYLIAGPASEDCLYLNVWTPARAAGERLPVLVWLYGGAFQQGGTTVPVYDGEPLAGKGVVVVTVNYRLGVYGFMAHPGLGAENPAGASGNYGLLDQVAALRWVQQNIAVFGGDPGRVTIAGQSAGASSVHFLIGSPLAKGLFHQAIAQSGTSPAMQLPPRSETESNGTALMRASGAADIAAMRRLTPAQLEAAGTPAGVGFGPTVDGVFLPDASFVNADTNDAPMLTGITADETSSIIAGYGVGTLSQLDAQLKADCGTFAAEFATLYRANTDAEAGPMRARLARENGLAELDTWAGRRTAQSTQPVYLYLFSHVEPGPDAALYGAFHTSDVPYAFGTLGRANRPFTATDRILSETMSTYWANYVKTGDPNGNGLPAWPRYAASAPRIIELGDQVQDRPLLDADKLSLFRRYVQAGGTLHPF